MGTAIATKHSISPFVLHQELCNEFLGERCHHLEGSVWEVVAVVHDVLLGEIQRVSVERIVARKSGGEREREAIEHS